MKEMKSDTLDDLLDPELTVFMFKEPKYWKNESRMINDEQLKTKLENLFDKLNYSSIDGWLEMFQNYEMKKIGKMAFLDNEFTMKWVKVGII